jgi:hypothetical protein
MQLSVGYSITALIKIADGRTGMFSSYFLLFMFCVKTVDKYGTNNRQSQQFSRIGLVLHVSAIMRQEVYICAFPAY